MTRKREEKLHRTGGAKIVFAIVLVIFTAYVLAIAFALFWAFYSSLKTNGEFFENMVAFPKKLLFSNYGKAFEKLKYNGTGFFGMFVNSAWFALGSAVLGAFMPSVTGYVFARYGFKCKEFAFSVILLTITLPIVGSLTSMYRVVYFLGINDSPLYLITALGGFGANFLIMYAFFKGIDKAYSEAAEVDGAGHFYIFLRIMLPFAFGPLFALTIVGFIAQWNNYETPLLFLDRMPTLASGLYRYSLYMKHHSDQPVYYAGVLMSVVPVIVIVAAFGGRIMKNMSIGGLKG